MSNNIRFTKIMLNNFYKNACNYCLSKQIFNSNTKKCTRIILYNSSKKKKLRIVFAKIFFCKNSHDSNDFKYTVLPLFR